MIGRRERLRSPVDRVHVIQVRCAADVAASVNAKVSTRALEAAAAARQQVERRRNEGRIWDQLQALLTSQEPTASEQERVRTELANLPAKLAEELGYDCVAKGSHYSSHPFQYIQQIPYLTQVALVAHARRELGYGCARTQVWLRRVHQVSLGRRRLPWRSRARRRVGSAARSSLPQSRSLISQRRSRAGTTAGS